MQIDLKEEFQKFLDSLSGKNCRMGQFIFPVERETIINGSKNIFFSPDSQFFWHQPKESLLFHSIGRIDLEKVFGLKQLSLKKEIFNYLKSEIISNKDSDVLKKTPLFLGNAQFKPFCTNSIWDTSFNLNWFIPKQFLVLDKSICRMVYNFSTEKSKNLIFDDFNSFLEKIFSPSPPKTVQICRISNRIDLPLNDWCDLVENALSEIKKGSFSKVVLSRMTSFDLEGNLSYEKLLESSGRYPACVTFFNKVNNSVFFGITPERLLRISDGIIETEALAGSIKRSGSPSEDSLLSEQLLSSRKNLNEQQFVTDYILEVVKPFADNIEYDRNPELIKLENIQHLKTKIKGTIKEDKFFLDLVSSLHPTPAVCGIPKEKAIDFIQKNESYERGLYSGIAGWFNLYDEGEFAVAIRSALIKEDKLYAFSGCGIVDGSDPVSEYEETEIKLKPIFSIFEYEN